MFDARAIAEASAKHPKVRKRAPLRGQVPVIDTRIYSHPFRLGLIPRSQPAQYNPSYGTGGFRAEGSVLDSTVFRCGMLAGLRSIQLGKTTGLMITASHNPVRDNGAPPLDSVLPSPPSFSAEPSPGPRRAPSPTQASNWSSPTVACCG